MSSIAKGITEEGWRVDPATGNRRPSDLNVGDRVSFTPRILHQVKPVLTGVRYSLVAWAEGL